MLPITIEKLIPERYQEAADLIIRTVQDSFGRLYPQALVDLFCQKYSSKSIEERAADTIFFVALIEEKLVGIIGLKKNQLRSFYVDPSWQGRGVGKELYCSLENEAKTRGVEELELEGSPLGQPVYLSFGFLPVEEIQKERGGYKYSDLKMRKVIN